MKFIFILVVLLPYLSTFAAEDSCANGCKPQNDNSKISNKATGDYIKDCATEIAKFCKNLGPKSPRLPHCLKENEVGISEMCKNSIPQKLNQK